MMLDHGGNLDAAIAAYGAGDWLDLSTGINPVAYPVPTITPGAWRTLPTATRMRRFSDIAASYFQTQAEVVPFAGAQSAIQAIPFVTPRGTARVLGPTYNEHLAALSTAGWSAQESPNIQALEGADLSVVVNPNNPDGQLFAPESLRDLAKKVGVLVIDESFVDTCPDQSLCAGGLPANTVVLRSFGKFFGLAGLRLGWAIAAGNLAKALRDRAGPWPVSGPAIEIAEAALADTGWQKTTRSRLAKGAARMDDLAQQSGWSLVGGTELFRTYRTPDAKQAQAHLASHHIWARIFPYSQTWIRLGLPDPDRFGQLERAFRALSA